MDGGARHMPGLKSGFCVGVSVVMGLFLGQPRPLFPVPLAFRTLGLVCHAVVAIIADKGRRLSGQAVKFFTLFLSVSDALFCACLPPRADATTGFRRLAAMIGYCCEGCRRRYQR